MTLEEALKSDKVTIVNYDLKTHVTMPLWVWKVTRWYWHLMGGVWVAFHLGAPFDGTESGKLFLAELVKQQETLQKWQMLLAQLKI